MQKVIGEFDLVGKPLIELYDMDSLLNGHEPVKGNFLMELSYWNTLIFEACESGKMEERFQLFCRMRKESIQPNSATIQILTKPIFPTFTRHMINNCYQQTTTKTCPNLSL